MGDKNMKKKKEVENLKYEIAQEMGLPPGGVKKKKKEKKTYN